MELMMSNTAGVRLAVNGKTDIGRVRDENEDAIRWHADATLPFGYVVIADGMGGYSGGSLASRIAVETFSQVLDGLITPIFLACTPDQQNLMIHSAIHNTINHANQSIIDAKHENPQFAHMGTTLVLALVWQDQLVVAHVGDSRAYMWSTAGIVQITKDHSVVQDMIDAGALTEEQARVSNVRNHITRALGVTEDVEPTIQSLKLNKSSLLLLCSDGLSEYFDNSELEHVLATHRPALECCYRLIDEANQCGGKDNISVGIIEFTANSTASPVVTDSVPTGSGEDTTVRRDRPIH
ncbi:Stp1/IreP family PP2C-type Ser/Thr phosphatase [Thalassolituus sp.]|uniref:Stp1/IreP family PP2C-type Ser/Thr phosphatase n=1 Tax=Thalassolituus sp. TaxID=2030822 RepID=UPI002A80D2B2|nr:Stp1/IreP family PP2C-type Ser/Thr phosphatase [Thalassolituus sp.]